MLRRARRGSGPSKSPAPYLPVTQAKEERTPNENHLRHRNRLNLRPRIGREADEGAAERARSSALSKRARADSRGDDHGGCPTPLLRLTLHIRCAARKRPGRAPAMPRPACGTEPPGREISGAEFYPTQCCLSKCSHAGRYEVVLLIAAAAVIAITAAQRAPGARGFPAGPTRRGSVVFSTAVWDGLPQLRRPQVSSTNRARLGSAPGRKKLGCPPRPDGCSDRSRSEDGSSNALGSGFFRGCLCRAAPPR